MVTANQKLSEKGEKLVVKNCVCFKCKRPKTLRRLKQSFKCADIICDFCGYLAQVKTITVDTVDNIPSSIRGAAWNVFQERLEADIYIPLFLVMISGRHKSIFYLPPDLQTKDMFRPRNPSTISGRTNPWQGFKYDFRQVRDRFFRIL